MSDADTADTGASEDPKPAADDKPKAETPPAAPPEGYVPSESLRAVTAERDRLKRAADAAERAKLEAAGEHEKLAVQERSAREAAEARAMRIARRAAFISAASGKVADADAAFTLAAAAGLVEFDVDDEGVPKDVKAPAGAVDEILKRHPFLKAEGAPRRGFGEDPRNGTAGADGVDPDKLSTLEKLTLGISRGEGRASRS